MEKINTKNKYLPVIYEFIFSFIGSRVTLLPTTVRGQH